MTAPSRRTGTPALDRTSGLGFVEMKPASRILSIATYTTTYTSLVLTQMMPVGTSVSQAWDIAESFYRLHPGMTAQDINSITGQALPLLCTPQGYALDIDRTKDKYDLRIDLSGRLERMNSTERHPEYILSDDESRAVARRHRCGGGKQFELQKEYAQLTSRTLDPSKMRQ